LSPSAGTLLTQIMMLETCFGFGATTRRRLASDRKRRHGRHQADGSPWHPWCVQLQLESVAVVEPVRQPLSDAYNGTVGDLTTAKGQFCEFLIAAVTTGRDEGGVQSRLS